MYASFIPSQRRHIHSIRTSLACYAEPGNCLRSYSTLKFTSLNFLFHSFLGTFHWQVFDVFVVSTIIDKDVTTFQTASLRKRLATNCILFVEYGDTITG